MNMKLRYRLFLRRKSVYYAFDDTNKNFTSLKTKDKAEAERLLMAMNEAGKQPAMEFKSRCRQLVRNVRKRWAIQNDSRRRLWGTKAKPRIAPMPNAP